LGEEWNSSNSFLIGPHARLPLLLRQLVAHSKDMKIPLP
jgi:hypothetical protein